MTTTLHDQILDAINQILKNIGEIAKEPTFEKLFSLNLLASDLYTLARQGDEYKKIIIEGIQEDWLKPLAVMKQLKTLLEEGSLPPIPTSDE
jgi:hypothetical protein